MNETLIADTWLYETLTGDSVIANMIGTRVYCDLADQDAPYPFIVFQLQSPGMDTSIVGMTRLWSNLLYTVRAVEAADEFSDNLGILASRIDALLHGTSGAIVSGQNIATNRERPFRMTEVDSGRSIKHLGGIYRMRIQAT